MRIVLASLRQRRLDPRREDYQLAVWRLQAHLEATLPGLAVEVHDVEAQGEPKIGDQLRADPPDLLGLSCYVWNLAAMARLAREFKHSHPRVPIVAGGPAGAAFLDPRGLAGLSPAQSPIDVLVLGEGEAALADVVRALGSGGPDTLDRVPGLLLPRGGRFTPTHPRAPIADLDSLASPYRSGRLRPHSEMLLEAARGCTFRCAFCSAPAQHGGKVRTFGPAALERELRAVLHPGLEASFFRVYFIEPTLNLHTARLRAICQMLSRVDPGGRLIFFLEVNPDLLRPRQIELLRAVPTNLKFGIGLQSLDPEVLRQVGRPPHSPHLTRNIRELSTCGEVLVEVILGLPGETPESFRRTLDYVLSLRVSAIVFRAIVAPGTGLWARADQMGLRYDPESFLVRATPTFSAAALDRAEEEAVAALSAVERRQVGIYGGYSASDRRMHDFEPAPRVWPTQKDEPGLPARQATVRISLGSACNQRCVLCDVVPHAPPPLTDDDLMAQLRQHQAARAVCWTGGEPTLHPRLAELCRQARAQGFGEMVLETNALRCAYPDYAAALAAAGVSAALVSLHAATAATSDALTRLPGSFALTLRGARNLIQAGVRVWLACVVTARNLDEPAALVELVRRELPQTCGLRFTSLRPQGPAAREPGLRAPLAAIGACLTAATRRGHELGIALRLGDDVPLCVLDGSEESSEAFGILARREPGRAKQPACQNCRWDRCCPGPWSEYLDGPYTLRPVPLAAG